MSLGDYGEGSHIFDALLSGEVDALRSAVKTASHHDTTIRSANNNRKAAIVGVASTDSIGEAATTNTTLHPAKPAGSSCCFKLVKEWETENSWLSYRNQQGLSPIELAIYIGQGQGLDVLHQMSPTPIWNGPSVAACDDREKCALDTSGIQFDAVVIPSGGIDDEGNPRQWVKSRLDAALEFDSVTKYYVCLSRATFHKPPCIGSDGYPVDEATSSASYLMTKGVNSSRILLEGWSFDTIGNAYGARQLICEPMGLRRLMVVTSQFHMRRTRLLFDWVFSLPTAEGGGSSNYQLRYLRVPNDHLTEDEVSARVAREDKSAAVLVKDRINTLRTLSEIARFVFLDHRAYMSKRPRNGSFSLSDEAKGSY